MTGEVFNTADKILITGLRYGLLRSDRDASGELFAYFHDLCLYYGVTQSGVEALSCDFAQDDCPVKMTVSTSQDDCISGQRDRERMR